MPTVDRLDGTSATTPATTATGKSPWPSARGSWLRDSHATKTTASRPRQSPHAPQPRLPAPQRKPGKGWTTSGDQRRSRPAWRPWSPQHAAGPRHRQWPAPAGRTPQRSPNPTKSPARRRAARAAPTTSDRAASRTKVPSMPHRRPQPKKRTADDSKPSLRQPSCNKLPATTSQRQFVACSGSAGPQHRTWVQLLG